MTFAPAVRSFAITAVFAGLGLAGLAVASASPEALVARSFSVALEDEASGVSKTRSGPLVSGTEEFWLAEKRRLAGGGTVEPAAWPETGTLLAFAPGEQITIGSGTGRRVLEIVSVSEGRSSSIDIKARDTAAPESPVVTLTITPPMKTGKAPRAL